MALIAGTRLGPYEIISAIGAGGMGEVYRARDTRLDRTVAIKILPEILAADPQFRERFDREAKAISQLSHPHICTLHDVGESIPQSPAPGLQPPAPVRFLVMEYLEGETLADRLRRSDQPSPRLRRSAVASAEAEDRPLPVGPSGPAIPLDEALRIAIEIASALDAAHRAGIVHRDLKPGNVMLIRTGVKLLDFGLAKAATPAITGGGATALATTPPSITAQGTILGTLQYMSPEQVEGIEADARTDIFAFGCVLYEMLTGRKAFEGKTRASLLGAILKDEPPPVSRVFAPASDVSGVALTATASVGRVSASPWRLDNIVRACLAKDPNDRFQSVHDVWLELQWVKEGGDAVPAAAVFETPRLRWRTIGWLAATIALALLTLAAGVVAISHWREPQPRATEFVVLPPEKTTSLDAVAVSPDGRSVVFVAPVDGTNRLWLRALDSVQSRAMAGTEGATYPFWSPDGRFIAFFAAGKLKKVAAAGGPPQTLCDAPTTRGGTWGADDVIVFAPTPRDPIHRVSAAGGVSKPITTLDASRKETSHRFPWFLPDGRHFLFAVGPSAPLDVFVSSVDADKPTLVVSGVSHTIYAAPGYLMFSREKTLLAQPFDPKSLRTSGDAFPIAEEVEPNSNGYAMFNASGGTLVYRHGISRADLVWFDRRGGRLTVVKAPDDSDEFTLSPDGQQLAVRARSPQGSLHDVWVVDLIRNTSSRFTLDAADHLDPTWSPDGKRIAFVVTTTGASGNSSAIYEKDASGARAPVELLKPPGGAPVLWDWTRDGRFLVYLRADSKTQQDIWALPLDVQDKKPFPVVQLEGIQVQAQVSPDNRWLAYISNESGRVEVYVQDFPTAQRRVQISTDGAAQPHWRGDSKELFYLSASGRMMAVPVRSGATFEAGAPVELFQTRTPGGPLAVTRRHFLPAPDGERFLVRTVAEEATATPYIVTTNWAAGVKK